MRVLMAVGASTVLLAGCGGGATAQSAGVGTFLDILSTGPGRLLGSGHPDTQDGGRRWKTTFRP